MNSPISIRELGRVLNFDNIFNNIHINAKLTHLRILNILTLNINVPIYYALVSYSINHIIYNQDLDNIEISLKDLGNLLKINDFNTIPDDAHLTSIIFSFENTQNIDNPCHVIISGLNYSSQSIYNESDEPDEVNKITIEELTKYSNLELKNKFNQEECPMCFESFETYKTLSSSLVLKCEHLICLSCAAKLNKYKCPLCRAKAI